MKNNKGVTIVELVVSMTVLIIIVTFLFQMVISLKEIYSGSGIKTELLNKQAIISKMINEDFRDKGVDMATKCVNSENCIYLYFKDGTRKTLEFIRRTEDNPAYLVYGDYKTELPDKSDFGNYKVDATYIISSGSATGLTNDSILTIDVPITNPLLKNQNFGINVVYQYNHNSSSIENFSIEDTSVGASSIWLAGSKNMIWYTTVAFEDPGYYYLDSSNNLIKATEATDDVSISKQCFDLSDNVKNCVSDTYDKMVITYQSNSDSTKQEVRTVNFLPSSYSYSANNYYHTFTAPVSGTYKIEAWGANGNSASSNQGGNGAYTSGLINLGNNEKLYVYVGGAGTGDNGGYNGGGSLTLNQSSYGGAGGGATDIRLKNGNWDSVDGLRSRIMVASGGAGASSATCGSSSKIGGNGGSINSTSFTTGTTCTDSIWTLAYGAGQTSGGTLDTFDITGNKISTLSGGEFGKASSSYTGDIISGGGGGYYGGTSSGYGSPATGGSSFVSGCEGCIAVNSNGTQSDSNIHYSHKQFTNIVMNDGSSISVLKPISGDNGYAKITLVSTSYSN